MARSDIFTHGYVVGILVLSRGDSDDEGRLPDAVASPNKPTFTRLKEQYKLSLPSPEAGAAGAFVSHERITTAVIQSGPHVGQLTSDVDKSGAALADATPGVELVVGAYRVDLGRGYQAPFDIEVTEAHTQAAPLDLYSAAPYVPQPAEPVTTVLLPAGASLGDVLTWGPGGPEWAEATGGGGGDGTSDHRALTHRDAPDQHPISAITGLQSELDGKVDGDDPRLSDARDPIKHDHPIVDVTGLQSALDGKAAADHDHDDRYYTESEVDTALDDKANATHQHPVADLTASGTPDDTTFLRGDGAWATPAGGGGGGVDWAFPQVAPPGALGRIYFPPAGGVGGNSGINGNLYLTCLLAGYGSIIEVGVNIVTAPAGATSLRLGIYAPDTHGTRPLTLLADAGVIDATTTGFKVASLASPVPWAGGPLWVGVYRMTGAGGAPQSTNMGHVPIAHARDAHNWGSSVIGGGCYVVSQTYDAGLPATLPGLAGSYSPLHVGVKVQ